jgi:hypothetical protein
LFVFLEIEIGIALFFNPIRRGLPRGVIRPAFRVRASWYFDSDPDFNFDLDRVAPV